ncbi:MAG: aldo/keto reductase family protein [Planctomycetota bacterium]
MEYRRVGNSGLKVSVLSVGGWLTFGNTVDTDTTREIIRAAVDQGVNSIDLADVYAKGEAERVVGKVLGDFRRSDLVVASKVFWPMSDAITDRGLNRKHIFESIDRTLKNLRVDYLDIYYCHREDPETPLHETMSAMNDLIRVGKVLYWGTSMWQPKSLQSAHALATDRGLFAPIVEQPQYSLLHRWVEKKIMPTVTQLGMGLMIWSPLAGGILTGKYCDGVPSGSRGAATPRWVEEDLTAENIERVKMFCKLAKEMGVLPGPLAISWLMHRPEVSSVILGATSRKQIEENLEAAHVKLPESVDTQIRKIFRA